MLNHPPCSEPAPALSHWALHCWGCWRDELLQDGHLLSNTTLLEMLPVPG